MAKKAHVPKFGDWASAEDVPYTQCFDNARKGKVAGGNIINPNDPESFNQHHPVGASPMRASNGPTKRRRDVDSRLPPGSPLRPPNAVARKTDPQRRANRVSAGGSDRSLEQSPLHHQSGGGGGRVGVNSPSWERRRDGLAPNTPGRSRGRPVVDGGRPNDGMPPEEERGSAAAAVPKFGEWDEGDPSSADGFTHIFNRVREEKQVGSARVPNMPKQPPHKTDEKATGCGCFGWLK